jgi:hypothetical protein
MIKIEEQAEHYTDELIDSPRYDPYNAYRMSLISFIAGAQFLLSHAQAVAVRPEANAVTQFEPFVYLKDLEGMFEEGEK